MEKTLNGQTPTQHRGGVKAGVFSAIVHDVEHLGSRTAGLLVASGILGVTAAIGITLLVSTQALGHQPAWRVATLSAIWTGLLIVCLAISLLRLRTPTLPLAQSAAVGVFGLALAGVCGAICPDQHFLHWWFGTPIGAPLSDAGGAVLSAACFGLVFTLFVGAASALVFIRHSDGMSIRPAAPALILLVLLAPGIALQSLGESWAVFGGWILGSGLGAYLGVAAGMRMNELFDSHPT